MAGRAFLAKLGLVSLVAGNAASLSVAVGTEQDAANRVGFYSNLTPAAERLGVVVGGVDVAEFNRVGLDLSANLGNVTRLDIQGRMQVVSSSNTTEIAFFGHPGFSGVRWGGISQGVVLESTNDVATGPSAGATFMSFFCDESASSIALDIGRGVNRTNRLARTGGGWAKAAITAIGRDQDFTTTTQTLLRIANRNPTASLTLTGGARYVEVVDRDTTLGVTTDIFAVEADRSVHVYTATDASSPTDGAFHVAGGASIEKSAYIGGLVTSETGFDYDESSTTSSIIDPLSIVASTWAGTPNNYGVRAAYLGANVDGFNNTGDAIGLRVDAYRANGPSGVAGKGIVINTYNESQTTDTIGLEVESSWLENNAATSSQNVYGIKISEIHGAGASVVRGIYIAAPIGGSSDAYSLEASGAVLLSGGLVAGSYLNQKIVTTAINATLGRSSSAVKQTAGGITTTLWAAPVTGDTISIRNAGGAANTIDGNGTNIEGAATFNINNGESVTLIYDGTQWTVF